MDYKIPYFKPLPAYELDLDVEYWNDNRLSYLIGRINKLTDLDKEDEYYQEDLEEFYDIIYELEPETWNLLFTKMKKQKKKISREYLEVFYKWKEHQNFEIEDDEDRPTHNTNYVPTLITRLSPFFPINKRNLNDESRRLIKPIVLKTSFGLMEISGWKLSTYDATTLFGLFDLLKQEKSLRLKTTKYQICKLTQRHPTTETYKATWESIRKLAETTLYLEFERNGKVISRHVTSILNSGHIEESTGKVIVTLNEFFAKEFLKLKTPYDAKLRKRLKGDITKGLHIFLQSQRPFYRSGRYFISLKKLCGVLNLDEGLKTATLRKYIKKSLKELEDKEYVERSTINKNDIVLIWKNQEYGRTSETAI